MAIRETPCHKPERPAVKTVGRLGVGNMVLYFGEREAHNRTRSENECLKQENAELRAAQQQLDAEKRMAQQQCDAGQRTAQQQCDAGQREFMQQQTEINLAMLDLLQLIVDEIRELRAQRNGNGNAANNPETAPP